MTHHLFGGAEVKNTAHSVFAMKMISLDGKYTLDVNVMDQASICSSLPRASKGRWMDELKTAGIFVNDLERKNPSDIEFLIGADILGKILTGNLKSLQNGLTATETRLGWTLMGEIGRGNDSTMAMTSVVLNIQSASVCHLWSLDLLGIRDPTDVLSQADKDSRALRHFQETVKHNENGRYTVPLPWVFGDVPIPHNKQVALQRLESTTRKLVAQGILEAYSQVFLAWKEEGIISRVNSDDKKCHYLPHCAVLKPETKTTPLRSVFDASCKVGRAPSLNGCLEKAPNLIELIPSLLMRFRMYQIGVTSDIRKAFQMMEVEEKDREFQRFFWWDDVKKKTLIAYRHNRVVFGVYCSPFLLGAMLNHHLSTTENQYPKTAPILKNSLYVENCVWSLRSTEEFNQLRKKAKDIFEKAGMELRQWERTGDQEAGVSNVLGLKWNKVEDSLCVDSISTQLPGKITKRVMLSVVHQIFDPLGFLTPTTLVPKLLIQRAWAENRKWDDLVSPDIQREFELWHNRVISCIHSFRVPRGKSSRVDCGKRWCD